MSNSVIPTLCLNMIVKNESKIIERLLNSVGEIIDSYCICDTGSTDNTIEIIETFFKSRNINGQIVKEPFRDFGYNRSFALKACEISSVPEVSKSTYILLLDADMIFWKNPDITAEQFKQGLIADWYFVYQGTDDFFYKNTRIVKNQRGFSYWGVTHEYVQPPKDTVSSYLERNICFIKDIGDGGCKADKFLRDIKLLSKGLEDLPNNDRYTFYLANSYRDSGQQEKAIETFKKRIELGGWIEEIWHSYYSIGKCYKNLNDMPNAIYYWLEGYNRYPCRIENLYEIIHYYRNVSKNELAYTFYALADYQRKKNTSWDYLFLQKDVYDYKIDYELSIIGYYCNRDNHDLTKISMKVLAHPSVDEGVCKNVVSNYKFYCKQLKDMAKPISEQNMEVLQSIGARYIDKSADQSWLNFVSSTPAMCYVSNLGKSELLICKRYVNYKIDSEGKYINQNCIETRNVIAKVDILLPKWQKNEEYLLDYDKTHDNVYVGLEDVRLLNTSDNVIHYCANRGLGNSNIMVEYGKINASGKTKTSTLLHYKNQQTVEKNWSIFEDSTNEVKCVYKWSPLILGNIVEDQFETTHEIQTPNFFKYMRGSTPGVVMGNEIWFINHIVSYEDRRYYYHIMVVLDRTTYQLKRYSSMWTFEKSKVEYTLGFVYMPKTDQFLIGYSVMDKDTKYMMVPKSAFDDMMISA
jgi:tetratricopeptide (TPR) repeat protein